ncbi:MAG: WG repeat-containing protein [Prevotella sp.]|nr:WG repeat-containing protein [Prevotella sp.]
MRNLIETLAFLFVIVSLCGCGGQDEGSHRLSYLAVQMNKNADWSIIDKDGNEVVKEEYPADTEISDVSDEGAFWVKSGDKYQLFIISQPKKPLIDEEFTQATNFSGNRAVVGSPNTPIRVIDTEGHVVATLSKDIKRCFEYYNGYAVVLNANDLYGVIDQDGKMVLKPAYTDIRGVSKGLVIGRKQEDDKIWEIINIKGEKQGEFSTEKYVLYSVSDGKIVVGPTDNPSGSISILNEKGEKMFDIHKAPSYNNQDAYYKDGFLVFTDASGKMGVVDDKGELQIRGRYEDMHNLGRGEFAAKKGDKWGVVNAKDETLVDFDFTDCFQQALGDNFLISNGKTWMLMNSENKEVTSFIKLGGIGHDFWADYVDIEHLVQCTAEWIESYEKPVTAKQLADEMKLDIDRFHYANNIVRDETLDGKMEVSTHIQFFSNMAEEKTHIEKVNDGWFTTDKVVSDGWSWSTGPFSIINGSIDLDNSIDDVTFIKTLYARIKQTHKEVSVGEYTRTVNIQGKTFTYEVKIRDSESGIDCTIILVSDQVQEDSLP